MKNLKWRASNSDGHFLFSSDNCFPVSQDLKSILEECRFHWHQILKVSQRDRSFQKLPIDFIGEMSEDELVRVGHEVVFIELVSNIFGRHLKS